MSKTKRFLRRVLIQIVGFIGLLVLFILNPVIMLLGPLRQLVFNISLTNDIWERDYEQGIGFLHFLFYVQIATIISFFAIEYWGADNLIQGVFLAVVIVVFLALQLQRMIPPYFIAVFATLDKYDKKPYITLDSGSKTKLHFRITNVGLTVYKNCSITVMFQDGFTVVETTGYEVADKYRRAIFLPNMPILREKLGVPNIPFFSYTTISPYSHLLFHVEVNTPSQPGDYEARVLLTSESTWGKAEQALRIKVTPIDDLA